ncbi:protein FAM92A [Folsomia candida]|uniref:protein FAM92A n=1 Tax=Folsomia candida TaxID=158441 RepID=UPI001604C042|nr:protein FAM92A [Folsomia candida]XP_035702301.1 protein FAM92A [Folsomia candida]
MSTAELMSLHNLSFRTAAILRVEKKVLPNLSNYKNICKFVKGEVTSAMTAQSRVLSKKKLVKAFSEKANSVPHYRHARPDAEKQYENAMAEFSRLTSLSQDQVIKFEHQRLIDLKDSLAAFFKIEISKHAKSLELLTDGYRFIHSIDENADLDVLKKRLQLNMAFPITEDFQRSEQSQTSVMNETKRSRGEESDSSYECYENDDAEIGEDEQTDRYEPEIQQAGKLSSNRRSMNNCNKNPNVKSSGKHGVNAKIISSNANTYKTTHRHHNSHKSSRDAIQKGSDNSPSTVVSTRTTSTIHQTDNRLGFTMSSYTKRPASSSSPRPSESLAQQALSSSAHQRPFTSPISAAFMGRRVTFNETVESRGNSDRHADLKTQNLHRKQYPTQNENYTERKQSLARGICMKI